MVNTIWHFILAKPWRLSRRHWDCLWLSTFYLTENTKTKTSHGQPQMLTHPGLGGGEKWSPRMEGGVGAMNKAAPGQVRTLSPICVPHTHRNTCYFLFSKKALNSRRLLKVVILKDKLWVQPVDKWQRERTQCRCWGQKFHWRVPRTVLGGGVWISLVVPVLLPLWISGISSNIGSTSGHPVWCLMPQCLCFCKLSVMWNP